MVVCLDVSQQGVTPYSTCTPSCQIVFVAFSKEIEYRRNMPTKKPRTVLILEDELLKRVDDFRYDNRIPTRSEAIRRLLEEALKKYERKPKK